MPYKNFTQSPLSWCDETPASYFCNECPISSYNLIFMCENFKNIRASLNLHETTILNYPHPIDKILPVLETYKTSK